MGDNELDSIIDNLKAFKSVTHKQIELITTKAKEILAQEANVVVVRAPVTICGDIHRQLHDLIELFNIGGEVPLTNYLFMGDFVDRGYHSVETVSLLMALKIRYPQRIFLTRGNHESRRITKVYGFYEECLKKYGTVTVWESFTSLFDYLPVSATVENQIFCLHGGLSPNIQTLKEIRELPRGQDIPENGPGSDLLWSDPDNVKGFKQSPRGAGFLFGNDVSQKFLETNGLKMIARAHQLMDKGYLLQHNNLVSTIFSAPNYCYRCNNLAAIYEVDEHCHGEYTQFDPYPRRGEAEIMRKAIDYFM